MINTAAAARTLPSDESSCLSEQKRRLSPFRRVLTFIAGAFLACVAMEVLVRQAITLSYREVPGFGYVRSSVLYRLEGKGRSNWTIYSLRRAAPPDPKRPSVLLLGDSYTEAFMVDDEEVVSTLVEAQLQHEGVAVQVLNSSYSGASPAEYVAQSDYYRKTFSPRWTVIVLQDDDLEGDSWKQEKAHFIRNSDGSLSVQNAGPTPFESTRRSRIKQLQRKYFPSMFAYYALVIRIPELLQGTQAEPPLFLAGSPDRKKSEVIETRYPVEEELDAMRRAYDGRVTFLYLAEYDPHAPTVPTATERRFQAYCTTTNVSCVDTRVLYRQFARNHAAPFGFSNSGFNKGHLNAAGHQAAASLLAPELRRRLTS